MLALVALDTGRGRAAFVTVAILEAGSMVLLALDPRRNMVYAGEKIGSFDGAAALAFPPITVCCLCRPPRAHRSCRN